MRPIIIIGCPKSGTQYISKLLTHLGLDIIHEAQCTCASGRDGRVSWLYGAGFYAIPFDGEPPLSTYINPIILHQVRNPLNTMSSCQKISEAAWDYISKYIPIKPEYSLPRKCLYLYYYWNTRCEHLAEYTYRIETLEEEWNIFCNKINHSELIEKKKLIKDIPKNVNTAKPYHQFTWGELLDIDEFITVEVMKLAERYNYDTR